MSEGTRAVVPADKQDLDRLINTVEILRQRVEALQKQIDNRQTVYGPFNQPVSPWYNPNKPCRGPNPYWLNCEVVMSNNVSVVDLNGKIIGSYNRKGEMIE